MNIEQAIQKLEETGLFTGIIKDLAGEIEGFHIGTKVIHSEIIGRSMAGAIVTILRDYPTEPTWAAGTGLRDGAICVSNDLDEVVEATLNFYSMQAQNLDHVPMTLARLRRLGYTPEFISRSDLHITSTTKGRQYIMRYASDHWLLLDLSDEEPHEILKTDQWDEIVHILEA